MVASAARGLSHGSDGEAGVLAVSVLTSLDGVGLREVGIAAEPTDLVVAMTRSAASAGAEGIVCSPLEISLVHEAAPDMAIVTPGIRPASVAAGDQRRVATPQEALAAGATWLVIGRAITAAGDPAAAAAEIASTLVT